VTSLMAPMFDCPRYAVNLSLRTGVPQPQLQGTRPCDLCIQTHSTSEGCPDDKFCSMLSGEINRLIGGGMSDSEMTGGRK